MAVEIQSLQKLLCRLLFLVLCSTVSLLAQDTAVPPTLNFHRWGSITIFNGLPSDSVRAIAQTPDGVMWFGTDNGVARFDGRRVQNFSFDDPDSNRIVTLKTDPNGTLWAGTQKGAFVHSGSNFAPVDGTLDTAVACFLFGEQTLAGTGSGAILKINTRDDGHPFAENFNAPSLADAEGKPIIITSLIPDGDRLIVATAGKGMLALQDGRYQPVASGAAPSVVNVAVRGADNNIWFGRDAKRSRSGVYLLKNGSRAEVINAPTAVVLALESDASGLWAGTARNGLFHLNSNGPTDSYTLENTSGGLRSNTLFAVFTDREGVVWAGTNRGVSRYDPQGPLQQTVSDIPNSNFVRTLWASGDGREILAGTNRGLFAYDGPTWKPVAGFANRVVYSIGSTMDDIVVGTSTGVFDSNGKLLLPGDARSIEMFRGDTYVAVYGRGVVNLTSREIIFPSDTATSLQLSTGGLLIGTAGNGLFRYDGSTVQTVATTDALKSGTIWKVYENADHSIWVTGQHGVFTIKDNHVEQAINCEDVRDVFVDGQDVWAATTTRGLLHARKDERLGWIVSEIGFEQGLPSEKAFSIIPMSDHLLVATNRGVVRYYPQKLAPQLIAVRILSQRLHDLGELASTIALDYPQNSILVEVAGQSSRTFPEEFQYSFLLKNAPGEVVDSRFATDPQYAPTNLPPGEYSIEAVAFNRDLLASEPLVIRFSIAKAPFPWTATALAVLLAIAVIGLLFAVIEHRRIKQRNRELAAARFDLANEAERERSRIARDLHDQTLADLRNLIMKSDKGVIDALGFRTEIESVSTEIRRICEDLSPSVLENVGLIAALEFLLASTIENRQFTASENIEENITFPINVQLQIYRIAQEVLTNIKKHSDARTVEMSIEAPTDGQFQLTIRDDGSPFTPNGNGRGRGISNIRSRAGLIGAEVTWKKRRTGGTAFSMTIAK
jgi:signal transduction histidine kinase/ligand-binding sensor domain-containing protein